MYGMTAEQIRETLAPKTIWEPQPGSQVQFLTCPYEEVLYEGTRGPGKTDALLMKFAQHVGEGYGEAWRGIIFRQTYPQLKDIIAKSLKWFKRIFPFAVYNKSDHSWTWPTGEVLIFSFMNDPIDYWNYHGHEYPFVGWEELTNWPDAGCYDAMKSCNRSSFNDPDLPPMPRFYGGTCNPFGIGHHWVKAHWKIGIIKPCVPIVETFKHPIDGTELTLRRCYIHGHWRENRRLIDTDPLYVAKLLAIKDENKRKAWCDGDWNIIAGSILGAWFNSAIHVLRPFPIPKGWKIRRSFDWGSSKPFSVGWWAHSDGERFETGRKVMQDGRLVPEFAWYPKGTRFRIAEWYGCKPGEPNTGLEMLAKDIARGILEREQAMIEGGLIKTVPKPGPADASIFDTENGHCIAKDMRAIGVKWTKADKSPGSRVNGWEHLRNLLAAALDKDEDGNPRPRSTPMEEPGLFVFDTCEDWIRTVPMLPRDTKKPDDVDTKAEDHAGDETRYEIYGKTVETFVEEAEL